ncbi:TspO/MBR family protein [Lactococcus garvieae]|uniref:TspO/MBR family protein n=1 Tax=Lactococcus garvieae TaxID=1363 RepID=UPI0018D66503|nr:TspO/MBR family protein [Lactococcus garvieae]QPS71786.1 tryptophan-rich sensory protein [Lactococcus garvieae]
MSKTRKLNPLFLIIIFIIAVEAIGGLSSLLAGDIKSIYNSLSLPPLAPPDYLFGIVWPILYALIAVAGFLVFQNLPTRKTEAQTALYFYVSQLFLNFIWSIIFFKGYFWLGVLVIIVLDIVVYLCMRKFFKINQLSGILFLPYFVWILFATYLTIAVAFLN